MPSAQVDAIRFDMDGGFVDYPDRRRPGLEVTTPMLCGDNSRALDMDGPLIDESVAQLVRFRLRSVNQIVEVLALPMGTT